MQHTMNRGGRPVRKAAAEAKARFGGKTRGNAAKEQEPTDPPQGEEEDGFAAAGNKEHSDMKAEEVAEQEEGKDGRGERQNEGEASTAPVPDRVCCHSALQTCRESQPRCQSHTDGLHRHCSFEFGRVCS